jgi:hypothetical protein
MSKSAKIFLLNISIMLVFLLLGCQQIFTFAPFGFAADDPATLSRDRLIQYGWDVMATRDTAKITAALNAMITAIAANPTDRELCYAAANLSLYLANVATVFISPPAPGATPPELAAYRTAYLAGINVPMLEIAAGLFAQAGTPPTSITLNATDNIFTAIGLLLTTTADNLTQLELITTPSLTPAQQAFVTLYYTPGIAATGASSAIWDQIIKAMFFPAL